MVGGRRICGRGILLVSKCFQGLPWGGRLFRRSSLAERSLKSLYVLVCLQVRRCMTSSESGRQPSNLFNCCHTTTRQAKGARSCCLFGGGITAPHHSHCLANDALNVVFHGLLFLRKWHHYLRLRAVIVSWPAWSPLSLPCPGLCHLPCLDAITAPFMPRTAPYILP